MAADYLGSSHLTPNQTRIDFLFFMSCRITEASNSPVDVEEPREGLNCELWIQRDRNGSERYLFIMV
jgi:hypothetical protein